MFATSHKIQTVKWLPSKTLPLFFQVFEFHSFTCVIATLARGQRCHMLRKVLSILDVPYVFPAMAILQCVPIFRWNVVWQSVLSHFQATLLNCVPLKLWHWRHCTFFLECTLEVSIQALTFGNETLEIRCVFFRATTLLPNEDLKLLWSTSAVGLLQPLVCDHTGR